MPTTATRPEQKAPIGRGHLHDALAEARDRSKLQNICQAIDCKATDVSTDGVHVDMPRLLTVLRRQGYTIGEPRPAPAQVQRGYTIWHVSVTLPRNGPSFILGYFTPNTS